MAEFQVSGQGYKSKKLDVFSQINIARRLMAVVPALGPLGPLMQGFADASRAFALQSSVSDPDSDSKEPAQPPDFDLTPMNPLFRALGELSDEDTQYIVKTCLAVTSRVDGPGFVPLWNVGANRAQYQDISFAETIQVVWHVIADNLGSFTNAPA